MIDYKRELAVLLLALVCSCGSADNPNQFSSGERQKFGADPGQTYRVVSESDRWSMDIDENYLGESDGLVDLIRQEFGFDQNAKITAWRYGLGDNTCDCEGFLFVVTPEETYPGLSLNDLAGQFFDYQLSLGYESVSSPSPFETNSGEQGVEWKLAYGDLGERELLFGDPSGNVVRVVVVDMAGITDKSFISQAVESFTLNP